MDLPWRIELLGRLRAQRGTLIVTRFATSRVAALLARLCLFPSQLHPREELIDLLWPDADLDAGRNNLRVALASLRRQLEPPDVSPHTVLIADRSYVRLSPIACRSDVADFEAALKSAARFSSPQQKRAALERALGIFGGELLPGFYDDWIVDERERLNALCESALHHCEALPHDPSPPFSSSWADEPEAVLPLLPNPVLPGFPLQFTRFFGREREQELVSASLKKVETRLVTLTGLGGAGKTRLAVEVAHLAASSFAGPICFVRLADLAHASLIPDAIAGAMALVRRPDVEPLEQVVEALSTYPPALLVLDNMEHLVDRGAPLLLSLLSRVPHLTCLVTSRRRLGLPAEQEHPVASLPLPDTQGTLEQIALNAGVQMFVDRAQAARPDFQITRSNAAAVAELCCKLDGIPLAIELVAARAQALTPAQMTLRLSERFALLTRRRGNEGGRHHSLWAAISWSYDLIQPPLQRFFAGLSVFRGGCTIEAAQVVCDEPQSLEFLTQLRERSLLVAEDGPGGVRFRPLETLREYAQERLRESGEMAVVRLRHHDFFLALAEEAESKLVGVEANMWLARLEAERDNMRTALDACSVKGDNTGVQSELRLSAALGRFWQARGYLTEGRERLTAALGREGAEKRTAARGWALRWAGLFAYFQGDYAAARTLAGEALTVFRNLGEIQGSGWTLVVLGNIAACQGAVADARLCFEEAMTCFREAEDWPGVGATLNNLGNMLMGEGNLASARPLYEEALALQQAAGNKPVSAIMLTNLGILAYYGDDLMLARCYLEASLALRTEIGNRNDQSGYLFAVLAAVALREGKILEAREHLVEGLTTCCACGDKPSAANLLEFAGRLHLAEGYAVGAARSLGAAARLRAETSAARDGVEQAKYEVDVAGVKAVLREKAFAEQFGAGEKLAWEQAIDEVLTDRFRRV